MQDVKLVAWHSKVDPFVSVRHFLLWTKNDDDWYYKETLTGHTATVWGVALSPHGTEMASVSDDTDVII
ncbi:putative cytosolic Fe-S cluster assembly factor [Phytophthora infestans]|uniref:Putative cytosolic Fe-S cluster assembly factor n=1 Tax=Phytophthora infestans TaxID=4787 RepID=A0A833SR70_PHYIN|nr:putative cytosolic Fe-S cluster assembly factor [Phytophthora infestans]KAF4133999.1 putative cytosolic Fe-S cluster assembly factor [Phytophthora infestans]